ncbi:hypothetical protein A9R01_01525 ['Osedax' symbiont bacterium Rs2_46_30_T18]|nr:hypothetical protein A9R01_01525 ['Osedax' symbiont bacterium Rs2_46_30_T18]
MYELFEKPLLKINDAVAGRFISSLQCLALLIAVMVAVVMAAIEIEVTKQLFSASAFLLFPVLMVAMAFQAISWHYYKVKNAASAAQLSPQGSNTLLSSTAKGVKRLMNYCWLLYIYLWLIAAAVVFIMAIKTVFLN